MSMLFILFGIVGAFYIILNGELAMGTSNGIPWGSLIAGYEFFVGISTGLLLVAALGYVFQVKAFQPVGRNAVILAIFTMFSGFAILLIELGNVFHMFYYFLTPNFSTPMWWMAPLYLIYLILLVVLLFYIFQGDQKKIKFYAILSFVSAMVALTNIGFLFGFLKARPYWYGPLSPLYFIVSAFLSGIAVISIAFFLKKENGESFTTIAPAFRKIFLLTLSIVMFIVIAKIITGLYGRVPGKYEAVYALLQGPLAINFWLFEIAIGMVIPLILLIRGKGMKSIGYAGFFGIIGLFFMRLDMVIAGQITPLKVMDGASKTIIYHPYTPYWSEWALIIGGIGLTILLYLLRDQIGSVLNNVIFGFNKTPSSTP